MSQQALDINNAALATTYNEIPYPSYVFSHCQPTRLHALAKIKGLEPTPVETAKVLEIGCSYGGNLIPFAIQHPESFSVGIDLSEQQIKVGQEMMKQIGLNNVELVSADISTVSFNIKFDYIICHGVFSWVPDFVQDAILSVIQQYLSPNGVAFISYNTYPGWKTKEIAKDFMQLTSNSTLSKYDRLTQAYGMINFTKNVIDNKEDNIHKINLNTFDNILNNQQSYIIHEYLEMYNKPFYFKEFIEKITQYNLSYITDTSTPTIFSNALFKENQFKDICHYFENNLEHIEQYVDFIQHRQFRCSLITHHNNTNKTANNLEKFENYFLCHDFFNVYIHLDSFYQSKERDNQWIITNTNITARPTPLNNALFNYLAKNKMNSPYKVENIFNDLKTHPDYNENELKATIWSIIHASNVYISYNDKENQVAGKKPFVTEKYRNLIKFLEKNPNITLLTNRYYNHIQFGVLTKYLIPYLDGTRTIKDLIELMKIAIDNDILRVTENGTVCTSKELGDKKIRKYIEDELYDLERNGFFNHY